MTYVFYLIKHPPGLFYLIIWKRLNRTKERDVGKLGSNDDLLEA